MKADRQLKLLGAVAEVADLREYFRQKDAQVVFNANDIFAALVCLRVSVDALAHAILEKNARGAPRRGPRRNRARREKRGARK